MNYFPYENLSDEDFENLVIRICKEVLGIGCKTFSLGKDGAKDSWFTGTADYFPSEKAQWTGTFNIQAKHTKILNASCSDTDFSVNQSSILKKEIARLKEIKKTTKFDNYILFTNRKLPGGAHSDILKLLREGLKIKNVEVVGREDIDGYLTQFPEIAYEFGIHLFASPLRFNEKELRDIIIVFSNQAKNIAKQADDYINSFSVIEKEKKNTLNNLSKEYFEFIKSHSLQYFEQIDLFLKDPKNLKFMQMYSRTVSDLKAKIILERDRFNDFMHLIEYLVEFVVKNNLTTLTEIRDKVRVFIHFMYFNCDIGKTK